MTRSTSPTCYFGVDWGSGSGRSSVSYVFKDAQGGVHSYDSLEELQRNHRNDGSWQTFIPAAQPEYWAHTARGDGFVEYARTDAVNTQKLYERIYATADVKRDLVRRALMIIDVRIAKSPNGERKKWQRERRYMQLRLQRIS